MIQMFRVSLTLFLALLIVSVLGGRPPCPLQSKIGSIISNRITVSKQEALVYLMDNVDTQCYNHTLPYRFIKVPEVAIAVHDFESRTTNDLYFTIKPQQSESLSHIPFLIRTQWRYTYWNKISFSFIAEDKDEIESGYYQVDSGLLGNCEPGKHISVLLPFRSIGLMPTKINHLLFLHGFQISTQEYTQSSYSPFQVQIVESATNSSGIAVVISVTTITQVNSVHISYLAWGETTIDFVYGNYLYESNPNRDTTHTPLQNIGRNYARIFGITGFIIKNQYQGVSLSTKWTGTKFVFDFGTKKAATQYMTFSYIFFIGSECSQCPGYPYIYKDQCERVCPPGSFPTSQNTCIQCGENYYYDGLSCVKLCPEGQTLDKRTNECVCPPGSHWTGTNCISCNNGKIFNSTLNICQCEQGTKWNGYVCAKIDKCKNGKQWNVFSFACQCPLGTFWNGTYCVYRVSCSDGKVSNSNNECVCPDGTYWIEGWCRNAGCTGGQTFRNGRCQCEEGYNWNGTLCLLCINGQFWNQGVKKCTCPQETFWNGNFCKKRIFCSGGRKYNEQFDQCLCSENQYWNGASCVETPTCCCGQSWNEKSFECSCPSGFNWDGHKCVLCQNGKHWDSATKTCVCQSGTQWNGQFCAVVQHCFGGMIWNQNTWACECPSTTVFNGQHCIQNYCQGGQVWDASLKKCICVAGKVLINNICVPPETTCKNGKTWSYSLYKCVCPNGQYDTGNSCETIPTCISNQIYNPLNNKCTCLSGLVWLASKNQCGDPTCPFGQTWNGFDCEKINCPPNSYYNGTQCVCDQKKSPCQPWEIFDGQKCIYFQHTCPKGTRWKKQQCEPISNCPIGFYGENNYCKPFPQRCIPPTVWVGDKCNLQGNECPYGTYKNGGSCLPQASCQNGQSWNKDLFQCTCPERTGWNGQQCVNCDGGQIWQPLEGCKCPDGHFFVGSKCEKPDKLRCKNIPNAYWDNSQNYCSCQPGFSVAGYQCICKGVPFDHFCDRCAYKPNSQWKYGICQCIDGYTEYGTECLPDLEVGDDQLSDCSVGTYFDTQKKKCFPCPDGCLSCEDRYTCKACDFNFRMDHISQLCQENCGDGYKYVSECDDGNNDNGDGCSADCKVQPGYVCRGGSPSSSDGCLLYSPDQVTLTQVGQIRYSTKIGINIKVDYFPKQLLQSNDCNNLCSSAIIGKVLPNSISYVSINSHYLAGSTYTFTIEVQFGKPYIPKFDLELRINPSVKRYFNNVGISRSLKVEVNPAYLASTDKQKLT